MKFWIARDKSGALYLFNIQPIHDPRMGVFYVGNHSGIKAVSGHEKYDWDYMPLLSSMFPEVTYHNSPLEVEISVKNK